MKKTGIYISAYNAEKTLSATIESVLSQTYKNYNIIIGDNGSGDGTSDIIKSYCKKYDFIGFYRNKKNFAGSFMSSLYGFNNMYNCGEIICYSYDDNDNITAKAFDAFDYICLIDSDDIIEPSYLEELVSYAEENDLDMVTCGWNFVRSDRTDIRIPEKSEIIYKKDFADRLSYYDKFMGPVWNKLFRLESLVKNITYYENKFSKLFYDGVYFYGADTAFCYFYLGNGLEKFGIIDKPLYNYIIHDESVSRKRFHPMRIIADRRMAEFRFDFLKEIGADISDENREFIMNIYHKSIKSTMDLLLNDDRYDLKERMKYLHSMFSYKLLNDEFDKKEEQYL